MLIAQILSLQKKKKGTCYLLMALIVYTNAELVTVSTILNCYYKYTNRSGLYLSDQYKYIYNIYLSIIVGTFYTLFSQYILAIIPSIYVIVN
jgi:hypothetical protein